MKRVSVIGLVLIGASAVTAAFIPAKKDKSGKVDWNGRQIASTAAGNESLGDVTCRLKIVGEGASADDCDYTVTKAVAAATLSGTSQAAWGTGTSPLSLTYTATGTTNNVAP